MIVRADVLDRAGDAVGDWLPRVGGALAVLVLGVIVVLVVARILTRVLIRIGLDKIAERLRVNDAVARMGLERSVTRLLVGLLRIAGLVAVALAAISVLGLQGFDAALNEAVLYLPKLIGALVLVFLGIVLGGLARERVDRVAYQMNLRGPLGTVTQVLVAGILGVVAVGLLGVPTGLLTVLVAIVVGGAALTAALAFGLGGRDLATEISAGRYVGDSFALGDRIGIGADTGEIVAIGAASILLRCEDGRTLRIPNSHLMRERVVVAVEPPA